MLPRPHFVAGEPLQDSGDIIVLPDFQSHPARLILASTRHIVKAQRQGKQAPSDRQQCAGELGQLWHDWLGVINSLKVPVSVFFLPG
jgi:hypothetical protein